MALRGVGGSLPAPACMPTCLLGEAGPEASRPGGAMRCSSPMTDETRKERLREALGQVFEAGGGEPLLESRFLALITLDSDTRLGLDVEARWVIAPADGREPFRCEPGSEHALYEVLESKRNVFEERLTEGALQHGLPSDDVVFAFPAVEVVRAVLSKGMAYTTRLALLWVIPSELRELRDDIARVSKAKETPAALKELAERLLVPR